MPELTVEQRVANGVELLDREVPDWWRQISASELNIFSCTRCVLGQLFGVYSNAPENFRWRGDDDLDWTDNYIAPSRGFDVSAAAAGTAEAVDRDGAKLAEEWRRVIGARREAATHG